MMYYNYGKVLNKENFDKERACIISKRIKNAENDENLIDVSDLDYYLNELQKMEVISVLLLLLCLVITHWLSQYNTNEVQYITWHRS